MGLQDKSNNMVETIAFILEETTITPDGVTTTRRVEVTGNLNEIKNLMGEQLPMLPEPKPEPRPKPRTWDNCLPGILRQQERIGQRQEKRARQAQKAICVPSRSLLQDFYEMIGG